MNVHKGRVIVKIGGSTLGSHDTTLEDLVALQRDGLTAIVVHGGGKTITEWLGKHGVATRFVNGLRVTDAESLSVAVAVLAGLVNKELVSQINSLGGRAIGLSGADGRMIEARVREPELGFVGDVVRINLEAVRAVISAGYIPVIAPLGFEEGGEGASEVPRSLLNINADTVAGEMAAAARGDRLVFLTDVEGIVDGTGAVVPSLDEVKAKELIATGVVSGGMVPKVEACLRALSQVRSACIIDGRRPHALLEELGGAATGTRFGS